MYHPLSPPIKMVSVKTRSRSHCASGIWFCHEWTMVFMVWETWVWEYRARERKAEWKGTRSRSWIIGKKTFLRHITEASAAAHKMRVCVRLGLYGINGWTICKREGNAFFASFWKREKRFTHGLLWNCCAGSALRSEQHREIVNEFHWDAYVPRLSYDKKVRSNPIAHASLHSSGDRADRLQCFHTVQHLVRCVTLKKML